VHGAYYNGLRYRCVHGSLGASAIRVVAMYVQRLLGVYRSVHAFAAPSSIMRDLLVKGGIPAEKIVLLRQPADPGVVRSQITTKNNTVIYFGRITEEKGLDVLMNAYQESGVEAELLVVGRAYGTCLEQLKSRVRPGFEARIHFKDFMNSDELSPLISRALLSIVPSNYYDNSPQSVMESYLHGTPVLGARIGGIPDEIIPGVTGDVFEPGDVQALAAKLRSMLADPAMLQDMGRNAQRYALEERSFDRHMQTLLPLLEGCSPMQET
jgi:glycosyltransferase involved in cell wall biosynthesis